jgi:hypothetical protein
MDNQSINFTKGAITGCSFESVHKLPNELGDGGYGLLVVWLVHAGS